MQNIDSIINDIGLVMIIYNWKGLKEENYLYTVEELQKRNPELCAGVIEFPEKWINDSFSANKTYVAKKVTSANELYDFIAGKFNDTEMYEIDEDWYWVLGDEDLFGVNDDLFGQKNIPGFTSTPSVVFEFAEKKWRFRDDMLSHYINPVSNCTFQDAENRLNELELMYEASKIKTGKVVDFGINATGGFNVYYEDGQVRLVDKTTLIEMLNM